MMNEWIISSSVLIAAVLLGRFLLRGKISLRLQYALWAVVLIRLLLPFQLFTSSFGAGAIAQEMDISEPVREFYVSTNAERYNQAYDDAVRHVAEQHVGVSEFAALEDIEREAHELAQHTLVLDLRRLLCHIWLLGMAVMTAVIAACNLHLHRRLKHRRRELDIPDSLLPVYITTAVPTPCIFGFFRPAVYLTPAAAKDGKLLHHVLTHELTHYRHLDHIWSVLRSLCLVLHWYNPLVWIAAKVSRADAELACDEGTLAVLGEAHRGEYGRTLIGLTCTDHGGSMFITATTMTGSAGSLRERIRLLMKRPRNTALTLTAMILLVTLIVGCAFSTAPESAPTETTPPETTAPAADDGTAETGRAEQELTQTEPTYALALKQAMEAYADKNPRELTPLELEAFQKAFFTLDENGNVNPAACFLYPYYDEIYEMDGGEFLAYFPTDQGATEEEFELLKAKYPDFFGEWTWETMPIPIHSYSAKEIEAVVSRWGNIHWQELDEGVHYLEETGLYYNYTSDFGLGGFYARCGFVYDGGAVVYSDFSALFFTETAGNYTIRAHLPALMIPAEDSPETAVKNVTEAFLTAYQENVYLYTDNEYDYLTVLAADPDAIAFYGNGQSVPMLDFRNNIQNVHDREAHWKQSRQEAGISRRDFKTVCHFQSITFDGDTATVMAEYAMSFTYDDQPGTTSGGRDEFKLLLVQVDGAWLIAEVTELGA